MAQTFSDLVQVKQQQFDTSIKTLLKESEGGRLVKYCQAEKNVEGETYTFYRINSSSTSDDIDYYDANYAKTAGEDIKVTVTPGFKYAHTYIKEKNLKTTKVDMKSAFSRSFVRALNRQDDATILAAIKDQSANLTVKGDGTKTLAEMLNTVIQAIAFVVSQSDDNSEHSGVAWAVSREEYSQLFTEDKFINNDYAKIQGNKYYLAGAEIVPVSNLAQGESYVIPSQVVCYASWKGGDKTNLTYDDGKDGYRIWARKSMAAGLSDADAPSVIWIKTKPAS